MQGAGPGQLPADAGLQGRDGSRCGTVPAGQTAGQTAGQGAGQAAGQGARRARRSPAPHRRTSRRRAIMQFLSSYGISARPLPGLRRARDIAAIMLPARPPHGLRRSGGAEGQGVFA
ncbi:hypothetical protein EDD91_6965 [Streptomyces sp. KS 21]|nr:hypothetical protein EDD91_6965 [Streptomyces sp. KS 21]